MSSPDRNRRDTARAAQQQEETLRARWEETQERLLTRFEEPISFATRVTKRTLAWFPVRVWRHFLIANGFLLAAGVSYQALFAIFAAVYVAFALAGLWLGGSEQAIQNLIDLINQYVPGLIDKDGPITPDAVAEIATNSASLRVCPAEGAASARYVLRPVAEANRRMSADPERWLQQTPRGGLATPRY